jgi:archaellum component FlaC
VIICQLGITLFALRRIKKSMATQEERLQAIEVKLTGVADSIGTLQQQLTDLKTNNPEIEDEIEAIETTVNGIADKLNPPAPPVEPTV